MSGELLIAGLPNYAAASLTTFSADQEAPTMPAENLGNGEPSEPARITTQDPGATAWLLDLGTARSVGVLAVVGHSIVAGGSVRFIGDSSATISPGAATYSESIEPDGIPDKSNTTGVYTAIDEAPSSPGGDWIGPTTTTSAWWVRVTFANPSTSPPATGGGFGGYQAFVLWVRRQGTPSGAADYPTVEARLFEGGVERAILGTKSIQSAAGQYLIFPWDAADLQTASGNSAEVRLTFSPGSTLATYAQLDALRWYALDNTDRPTLELDSGWLEVPGDDLESSWGSTAVSEVGDPLTSPVVLYVPPSPVSLRRVRVEVRDDGAGWHANFSATPARSPNGFVEVGCLVVSPLWRAPFNFAYGASLRVEGETIGGGFSFGGQTRDVDIWKRRIAEVTMPVNGPTAASLLQRIDAAAGRSVPFLVSLEPESADAATLRNGTFWTIAEGKGIGFDPGFIDGQPRRSVGYRFTEKL